MALRDIVTLYASPAGGGDGFSAGSPCSLPRAFVILAELRGGGASQPLRLRLLSGEYYLKEPLSLSPRHFGITVEPYGDGPVTLSGGKRITGWTRDVFNGIPCFSARIDEVARGEWQFTDLYVDGLRADPARFPAEGTLKALDVENHSTKLFDSSRWFVADKKDVAAAGGVENALVNFCHYWIDEHSPVAAYDPDTGRVTLACRSRFSVASRPGYPCMEYWLENIPAGLTAKNQFYLDKRTGTLYYIPRSEEQTPENIEAYAPRLSKLLAVTGDRAAREKATAIRFSHIRFRHSRGDYASGTPGVSGDVTIPEEEPGVLYASDPQAVAHADGALSFEYAENCALEQCTIQNYGVHGVAIGRGCQNVRIEGCRLYDGGAGGVTIGGGKVGCDRFEETAFVTVSDCTILHVGRRWLSACGVLLTHAHDCVIAHNEIGDLFYTGISVGWVWGYAKSITRDIRVEYNHIHDLGQGVLSDMGGVYLLGAQPGTLVRGNVIHDIRCKEYGGWALYTDEGSAGIELADNLCYNTSSNSYHQNYGTMNTVRNNIFAFSGAGLLCITRPENHLCLRFENNICCTDGQPLFQLQKVQLDGEKVVSTNNLLYDYRAGGAPAASPQEGFATLEELQKVGLEQGSIVADPLFKDPKKGDFTLLPASPAFALGFGEPLWRKAGPRE